MDIRMTFHFTEASTRIKRLSSDKKLVFDMTVVTSGTYDPGYEPRYCLDHDHPDFGDPGCGPELDVVGVIRVEDIEIIGDESHLSSDDQNLLMAIDQMWDKCGDLMIKNHTRREMRRMGLNPRTLQKEYESLTGYLWELFATRHGVGPWDTLVFSELELRELEENVIQEMEDMKDV